MSPFWGDRRPAFAGRGDLRHTGAMSLEYFVNGKGPEALLRRLSACLSAAGGAGFEAALRDLLKTVVRADLCTVYGYGAGAPVCLLAHGAGAGDLAARYTGGGYRDDPLWPLVAEVKASRQVRVLGLPELREQMPEAYLRRYFTDPGLADAIMVLGSDGQAVIGVTFGRADRFTRSDPTLRQPFWETILGVLLVHYGGAVGQDTGPLATLSERERAICRAMLRGLTADAIAFEMGISASTVKTYRRRAYDKLGINSKPALFALCGAG